MNRKNLSKNNKGASLVLVIVAMLFVGIIASIILTITVGNSKSTKATIKNSSNFYSAESVLDDLKMYLRKLAISAATDAYASVLEGLDTSTEISGSSTLSDSGLSTSGEEISVDEAQFISYFRDNLEFSLRNLLTDPSNVTGNEFGENLVKAITLSRGDKGKITIKYGDIQHDIYGNIVLKNVVVTMNEEGFESSITTDITFKAKMPTISVTGDPGEFTTPIDHFLIIAGGDIGPSASTQTLDGTLKGNLYTEGNLKIKTGSSELEDGTKKVDSVSVKSQMVLVGRDIVVDNGIVSFGPMGDNTAGTETKSEVWCRNFKVGEAKVTTTTSGSGALVTDLFLEQNLELNGDAAEFKANNGKIYAYSNGDAISAETKPVSSAIILNGLGAKLDLSSLSELQVAGKAYTALSDIDGVYESYKDSTTDYDTGIGYFTQGESITYRALQPLYLIPGDFINPVGHNPMKESEFYEIKDGNKVIKSDIMVTIPDYMKPLLVKVGSGSGETYDPVRFKEVRYVSGGSDIYLFWNFKSTEAAVTYFDKVTGAISSTSSTRYEGLLQKQIQMLRMNGKEGYLKLPESSKVKTQGNAITYDGTINVYSGKGIESGSGSSTKGVDSGLTSTYTNWKSGLMKTLDKNDSTGTSLIANMFKNQGGLKNTLANKTYVGNLIGPLQQIPTGNTSNPYIQTYKEQVISPTMKYVLVTGPNVDLMAQIGSLSLNTTYIIISPGNVNINLTSKTDGGVRCLIIAGGKVSIDKGTDMTCLGVIPTLTPLKADGTEDTDNIRVNVPEFSALLQVMVNDSVDNANTILRKIFGVADGSYSTGSGNGDDFVTLEMNEWKRN